MISTFVAVPVQCDFFRYWLFTFNTCASHVNKVGIHNFLKLKTENFDFWAITGVHMGHYGVKIWFLSLETVTIEFAVEFYYG